MSSEYNEDMHPRGGDGKFTKKDYDCPPGGTSALESGESSADGRCPGCGVGAPWEHETGCPDDPYGGPVPLYADLEDRPDFPAWIPNVTLATDPSFMVSDHEDSLTIRVDLDNLNKSWFAEKILWLHVDECGDSISEWSIKHPELGETEAFMDSDDRYEVEAWARGVVDAANKYQRERQ